MKFNIGDTVKIKVILYCEKVNGFVPRMEKYCGKVAKVVEIENTGYKLDIDKGAWYWYDDMLEPVQKEYNV